MIKQYNQENYFNYYITVFIKFIVFARTKKIQAIDSIIALKKIKFDSLNLKSSDIESQLSRIDYC